MGVPHKNKAIHARKYYLKHRKRLLAYRKKYYHLHRVECLKKFRLYRLKNKIILRKYYRAYTKNKLHNNLQYKLCSYLRNRIYQAINNNIKSKTTLKLLGCSIKILKAHLEAKFKPGMSWSNYGKWHIDHIKPCASFDLSKPKEQQKCFNYLNLQPLWALENLKKGKR